MALFKKEGILGLDIGTHLVKVVELRRREEQLELTNLAVTQLFQVTEKADKIPHQKIVADTLKSMLSAAGMQSRQAAIAVSSRDVIVKRIEMDRMTEEEVRQIIRWEAEQHIPLNIDDVYLDFHILNPEAGGNQMDVLLVAGKKMNVESRIDLAMAAGLDPIVVDVDAFAIQNAFEISYPECFADVVCLLNIGRDMTVISLVREGIPLFTRDIPFGNTIFVEKVRKGMGVSNEEAETYALGMTPEGIGETEVRQLVAASVEDLVVGMTRTFSYLKTLGWEEKPKSIYVSGGGAKIPGLIEVLESRLKVPTEISNPLRNLQVNAELTEDGSLEEISPLLMQAIGLGLR